MSLDYVNLRQGLNDSCPKNIGIWWSMARLEKK